MLTKDIIMAELSDLEQEYRSFMVEHFADWRLWAEASQRMSDGEQVQEAEIPPALVTEYRFMEVVLEMEAAGTFDWANPKLRAVFAEVAQSSFYKTWGELIARISLRLARIAGVQTLIEIGAGRGNLTGIMLDQRGDTSGQPNLIITDANPVVLENMQKLTETYSQVSLETFLWDIRNMPSQELRALVHQPCLLYERASIVYATIPAIENLARVADLVVFGDYFNNTGRLYAYDEIAKRIGVQPLFYDDIRPVLEQHFKDHFLFDIRAQKEIDLPNTTLLIAWK